MTATDTNLIFTARRKDGSPKCPVCGYNLTGNTSGVCPECGSTIQAKEAS